MLLSLVATIHHAHSHFLLHQVMCFFYVQLAVVAACFSQSEKETKKRGFGVTDLMPPSKSKQNKLRGLLPKILIKHNEPELHPKRIK